MTIEEQLQRLTGIVDALANTVVAHDNQIESLIRVAEKHDVKLEALIKLSEENAQNWKNLERQWQAYINRLPRQ